MKDTKWLRKNKLPPKIYTDHMILMIPEKADHTAHMDVVATGQDTVKKVDRLDYIQLKVSAQ
ncbi:MAG: hypothetical protein WCJ74_00090 [bacterium]